MLENVIFSPLALKGDLKWLVFETNIRKKISHYHYFKAKVLESMVTFKL